MAKKDDGLDIWDKMGARKYPTDHSPTHDLPDGWDERALAAAIGGGLIGGALFRRIGKHAALRKSRAVNTAIGAVLGAGVGGAGGTAAQFRKKKRK